MIQQRSASSAVESEPAEAPEAPGGEEAQPVDPSKCRVWEDEFRSLHLEADGKVWDNVRPVRVFPVSRRSHAVSFLDGKEREVAIMAHPKQLDKASRRALRRALDRMYYAPRIIRVLKISEKWGVSCWEVETDCGFARFEVTDREHIRRLPGGRYLIHDADGNRFEIPNLDALDHESWKMVQSET